MRALRITTDLSNDQAGIFSKRNNLVSKAIPSKGYDGINTYINETIDRDKSGGINYEYYVNRARTLHSKAIISFCHFIWSSLFK
ncbi:MAG: hypothetical protein WBB23_07895 [Desulforhopalus sp.]